VDRVSDCLTLYYGIGFRIKKYTESMVRIGEIAGRAGVNIQTLRYYERRGLLAPASRRESGYREYDEEDVRRVRFIRRAQDLGFTLEEIGDLLAFQADAVRSCAAV